MCIIPIIWLVFTLRLCKLMLSLLMCIVKITLDEKKTTPFRGHLTKSASLKLKFYSKLGKCYVLIYSISIWVCLYLLLVNESSLSVRWCAYCMSYQILHKGKDNNTIKGSYNEVNVCKSWRLTNLIKQYKLIDLRHRSWMVLLTFFNLL